MCLLGIITSQVISGKRLIFPFMDVIQFQFKSNMFHLLGTKHDVAENMLCNKLTDSQWYWFASGVDTEEADTVGM